MIYKYSNDFSISHGISTVCTCVFTYCRFFKMNECFSCMSDICFCWDLHLYMNTIWMNTLSLNSIIVAATVLPNVASKLFYSNRRCCTLFLCFFCSQFLLISILYSMQNNVSVLFPHTIAIISRHMAHESSRLHKKTVNKLIRFQPPPPYFFPRSSHQTNTGAWSVLKVFWMCFSWI